MKLVKVEIREVFFITWKFGHQLLCAQKCLPIPKTACITPWNIYPVDKNLSKSTVETPVKVGSMSKVNSKGTRYLDWLLKYFFFNCDGVALEIYLDHKFQWPQDYLNCESLSYKVVT